jgi:UDP-glucose 4-epimerase
VSRIVVTGGNGFIGRHLVKKLLSCNTHSIALISNSSGVNDKNFLDRKLLQDKTLTIYTADIRDTNTISQIIKHERADTCIHLAAKISVLDSINNPEETLDVNVKGTLSVLEACYQNQVNNFVFASSAAVYGDVKELPISESHSLEPLSPYGTSKVLAEQHVSSYSKLKRIQNAVILRIFNVYGYGLVIGSDVVTKFASKLSKGLPPIIYGGGIQTRDFISVDDVTDAFLFSIRAMEDGENNDNEILSSPIVFNIGTGIPTSINQLAQKMISIFGLDILPIYEEGKKDDRDILHSYADMTKANEVLHFVPKKAICAGLRELIESMFMPKPTE